jgi:threonine/homoserine/homoserine lactone efflux protein
VDLSILSSYHWFSGLLIGLVGAAPIGPVNIMVIQRSLQRGRRSALWLGASVAMGDLIFATVAAFGLGAVRLLFDVHLSALRMGSGLFMIIFGVLLWRKAPHLNAPHQSLPPTLHMSLAVLVMTLTNPATLLWFIAAFAMVRFHQVGLENLVSLVNGLLLVLGVFCGSMLWWIGLSDITMRLRGRLKDIHLLWMNHGCAALLIGLGLFALLTTH